MAASPDGGRSYGPGTCYGPGAFAVKDKRAVGGTRDGRVILEWQGRLPQRSFVVGGKLALADVRRGVRGE